MNGKNDVPPIFISWSGPRSLKVARALKDLIEVVSGAEAWFSEDAPGGKNWFYNIQEKLQECNFGVFCITKDNLESPWLHYEAGAIGKQTDSTVWPLVLDVDVLDLNPPLSMLMAKKADRDSVLKLMVEINRKTSQIHDELLAKRFNMSWAGFDGCLKDAINTASVQSSEPISTRNQSAILEDIVSDVRQILNVIGPRGANITQDALLGKLIQNRFLEKPLERLCSYTTLFHRTDQNQKLKEELARFFWDYCSSGICRSTKRLNHVFFESGSTIAYVAERLLYLAEDRSFLSDEFLPSIRITTNNVLVFVRYFFTRLAPLLELRPHGLPDKKYGATYGILDGLNPYPPPFYESKDEDVKKRVEALADQLVSPASGDMVAGADKATLLILASTSGMNCGEPFGPHVGSYQNVLFKRSLLRTRCPIVFFVDESKFLQGSYDPSRCYIVCGKDSSWHEIVETQPIAFCVGAKSADSAKKIIADLMEIGLSKSSSPAISGEDGKYMDCFPFLVANDAFAEQFPGIPLDAKEKNRWLL